jgi:hypothetical protein
MEIVPGMERSEALERHADWLTPISFSFIDGVDTITNLTASVSDTFQVETGPTGNITAWDISLSISKTFLAPPAHLTARSPRCLRGQSLKCLSR